MTFGNLMQHMFSPVNAVLTILLILSVIYWLVTIIGGLDVDLDLDADIDINVDTDISHVDGQVEVTHNPSDFVTFLKFLNLDIIPITFFLTLTLLFTWFMSLNVTYYLNLPTWLGLLFIIPEFILALFVTKIITTPLKGIFRHLNHKGEETYDFLGRRGTMVTSVEGDKLAMAEVNINNDPIKLMVKSLNDKKIEAGETVLIIDESKDKKYYLVEKYNEIL